MITDEELKKLIKDKRKNKEITPEQREENIIEWTTLYRRNFDLFNEDYLGIKNLCLMQKQMINTISDNDITTIVASRGLSKENKVIKRSVYTWRRNKNGVLLQTKRYNI